MHKFANTEGAVGGGAKFRGGTVQCTVLCISVQMGSNWGFGDWGLGGQGTRDEGQLGEGVGEGEGPRVADLRIIQI